MSYYMVLAYQAQARPAVVDDDPAEVKPTARKRARHPAGSEKGGEFVADDPATPDVNEAFAAE